MDTWWVYIIDRDAGSTPGSLQTLRTGCYCMGDQHLSIKKGPASRTQAVKREQELEGWSRQKKKELFTKASEQNK